MGSVLGAPWAPASRGPLHTQGVIRKPPEQTPGRMLSARPLYVSGGPRGGGGSEACFLASFMWPPKPCPPARFNPHWSRLCLLWHPEIVAPQTPQPGPSLGRHLRPLPASCPLQRRERRGEDKGRGGERRREEGEDEGRGEGRASRAPRFPARLPPELAPALQWRAVTTANTQRALSTGSGEVLGRSGLCGQPATVNEAISPP